MVSRFARQTQLTGFCLDDVFTSSTGQLAFAPAIQMEVILLRQERTTACCSHIASSLIGASPLVESRTSVFERRVIHLLTGCPPP